MNTDQLHSILQESATYLDRSINLSEIKGDRLTHRHYEDAELNEFIWDLIEIANSQNILFAEYALKKETFLKLLSEIKYPVIFFSQENSITPQLVKFLGKNKFEITSFESDPGAKQIISEKDLDDYLTRAVGDSFFAMASYDNLVSEPAEENESKEISPLSRLLRLLKGEKRDILYILFYAVIAGSISLILPLGIQTTVEMVSGGVFFSSIYIMIGLIIAGVIVAGGLQIVQLSMVEFLQQRIFTKASYEFAFRLPRLKTENLHGHYPPELVNRFFDILTIQKSLPKLLIDLSSASLQIFFGLALISLYHPFFMFFGLTLMLVLFFIFFFTGSKGLSTSINESKYKYKVVYWLQELGRTINSFKVAGKSFLPIRKTDSLVNNYLKYRKGHFNILITQFWYIVLFKAAITAALLIMGTILVVERQITLGQFVASEVIIILILNSVEKIIAYMDVVYDLLTAVDKVGHVTDMPLEKSGGIDLPHATARLPISIAIKDLKYKYPDEEKYSLNGITMTVAAGERICISGEGGSGKSTLGNVIAGLYHNYEGVVSFNGLSLRDLDVTNLRDKIAKNISPEDLFEGTLLENITVGKLGTTTDDALAAIEQAGLKDWVDALPEGLSTRIQSRGLGLSAITIQKLILCRCLAERPTLLVLKDLFYGLQKKDKLGMISTVIQENNPWTLVAVSNDPMIMSACDRVILLQEGRIVANGPFEQLLQSNQLTHF
ncbi:MAG: ATP-binding cassette domain-containing protein [Bacteroidetes bacterium]|nr:ATP-binding cassette domain-containing protein [Bacteroidota bacterium]